MNKVILSLLFVVVLFSGVSAQDFYGGLLAGFNGSQVEGDLSSGYNKMGVIGGAWVQRNLPKNFYWGMELKFNQKGSRINPTAKNGRWKYVYRLNYIDLPVLLGYQYNQYSVFCGGSFAYLINKSGYNNYGDDPTVLYDDITKWELGMFAGIRTNFDWLVGQAWAKKIILETRFQYSVFSIDEDHDFFYDFGSGGQFNNVISIVLYYQIGNFVK